MVLLQVFVYLFFSVAKEPFTKGEKRMNRAHYLKTDIRRLIKNYPIYLGIVGVAISMWFSLEDSAFTEGMVNGNALDTYDLAVGMSGIMIAYVFCAFLMQLCFVRIWSINMPDIASTEEIHGNMWYPRQWLFMDRL